VGEVTKAVSGDVGDKWGHNGQHTSHLAKTTTNLTILHELKVNYLRTQLQTALWTEETKYCSQPVVRPLLGAQLQWISHKTKESEKKP
jgi:hypothetical protein